jgi:hypothetical protein
VHARMQVSPGECNGHLGGHTEFINGRLVNWWAALVREAASRMAECFHNFCVLAWMLLNPLIKNADGTVTLYFQSTSPGKDKEANWLPTPKSGRWYMNLRAYAPAPSTIASAFNYDVYAPAPIEEVK